MRTIWSGSLLLGVTTVPVKLHSASERTGVTFATLHRDCGTRINQVKMCPACDKRLGSDDTVKGWEYEKGKFLPVEDYEIEQVARSRVIEIVSCVPAINSALVGDPYWLSSPQDEPFASLYAIFRDALIDTTSIAIGRFSIYNKERMVAISPSEDTWSLMLHMLRFGEELRPAPEGPRVSVPHTDEGFKLMKQMIEKISVPAYIANEHPDSKNVKLRELLHAKLAGKRIEAEEPLMAPAPPADILESLRASMAAIQAKKEVAA